MANRGEGSDRLGGRDLRRCDPLRGLILVVPPRVPWLLDRLRKERVVAQEFNQGDTVEWNTPQGKTRGTAKKKLTSETEVGGQKVKASEDDPRYLVESEKSGKEAAHKPDALNNWRSLFTGRKTSADSGSSPELSEPSGAGSRTVTARGLGLSGATGAMRTACSRTRWIHGAPSRYARLGATGREIRYHWVQLVRKGRRSTTPTAALPVAIFSCIRWVFSTFYPFIRAHIHPAPQYLDPEPRARTSLDRLLVTLRGRSMRDPECGLRGTSLTRMWGIDPGRDGHRKNTASGG
jgi:hypothetical protein